MEFNVNLESYKVFFYAASLGNITLAAEKLYLTQPSVTKAIQRLEERLDCQLFTRTKRGVILTAEGKALWAKIEPACRLILAAERELNAIKSLDGGTLSVASSDMGFGTYVMPALKKFRQDHPNIKVRFRSALTDDMVKMLQSGAVDLVILFSPYEPDEAMETYIIDVLEEYLVAGPKYAHLADRENTLIDLKDYPFISLPEGSAGKEYVTRCFQKYGLTFEPDIEVPTVDLVIQAIMNNFGIGILPRSVVEDHIKRGALFHLPLSESLPERPIFAITNRMLPISVAAQTFIKEYLQKP